MYDGPKVNFSAAFKPTSAFPLDARYYFDSYEDAKAAAESASEVGGVSSLYYFGQTVVVMDGSKATLYIIQPDGTLKEVGTGGGGGGGGEDTKVSINAVDWPTNISEGSKCELTVNWSSLKEEVPTGNGTIQVYINNELKTTLLNQPQGNVKVDVSNILNVGNNTVKVRVIDVYENSSRVIQNINVVSVYITSTFDGNAIYGSSINYTYKAFGKLDKNVKFIVDGVLKYTAIVKTSGESTTQTISGLTHGHHSLEVYFDCIIDGNTVTSNKLIYDLICDSGIYPTPIIASTFNELQQEQYEKFVIKYRVYTPNYMYSDISLLVNGEVKKTLTVDRNEQTWEIIPEEVGTLTAIIKCQDTMRTFNIEVKAAEIDVKPVTENLALYLSSVGRSNAEPEETRSKWDYKNYHGTLTGFNFTSDGWVSDEDSNTVLRVAGDARVNIDYKIFGTDFKSSGKTIEIEFSTREVLDYDATILSCWSGEESKERGILVTAQLAKFKSLQSAISTQYKEEEHVRLSLVIEKGADSRLIYMYLNGVACGVTQYPTTDTFVQATPVGISIGNNNCTVDIYCIRVYDNDLTRKQVVTNWIADTQSTQLKKQRYVRNDNYDEYGNIIISKLPAGLPYMIWDINPLPQYKGDKRLGDATYVDVNDDTRSFTSKNATYNVQGTSSSVYPVKNIRIKFKKNKDFPTAEFYWKDSQGNDISAYPIRTGQIGDNYFTYKVDYASSEGANNVELVRLYNDTLRANDLLTPPMKLNDQVRVGIDGFPIISFHKDEQGNISFNSKANFNNDKANESVYGFLEGDESWEILNNNMEQALFKSDDLTSIDPESGNPVWQLAFESRYPDVGTEASIERLQTMLSWVVSTYREKATETTFETPITFTYTEAYRTEDGGYDTRTVTKTFEKDTAEYRLTKFKAELKDHFDVNATLFYYLYTELYLLVDSRGKNAFPTYFKSRAEGDGGDRWFWLPYDMDTAIGINNEGALVFDYALEDTDKVGGADVYNAQSSVLWCNVRDSFSGELGQLYQKLRTQNLLSYNTTENRFEEHQSKWSESIFNEDSYKKYIVPFIEDNENYLAMLQGSKAEQRKWWLYNRFRYLDSKYFAGDSKSDTVILRAYQKANISVTPYADIYASVQYGNTTAVSTRAKRREAYTLTNPLTAVNDTEYTVFSASQLLSIGDLSEHKVGLVNISRATRLQELIVGKDDNTYINNNLGVGQAIPVSIGANKLLRKVDFRNCPLLTQPIDISNCNNVEEAYFDATSISGVSIAEGGLLKKLYLPDVVSNLKIKNQKNLQEVKFIHTEYTYTPGTSTIESVISKTEVLPTNIESLWLENVSSELIDYDSIIRNHMPATGLLRIVGLDLDYRSMTEYDDVIAYIQALYTKVSTMHDPEMQTSKATLNGKIYVNEIDYADYMNFKTQQPDIEIVATMMFCKVDFLNDGVPFIESQRVLKGQDAIAPTAIPTREPTQQYYYEFDGWDKDWHNVQTDLTINATYRQYIQKYTVEFDLQSEIPTPIPSQEINYGEHAIKPADPHIEGCIFTGWYKEPACTTESKYIFEIEVVTDDIVLYAGWIDESKPNISVERNNFKKFTFTATDNVAITAWKIEKDGETKDWTPVSPTSKLVQSHEISASGSYTISVKDNAEHTDEATMYAYDIFCNNAPGVEIKLFENSLQVGAFALASTTLKFAPELDEHYEFATYTYSHLSATEVEIQPLDTIEISSQTGDITFDSDCSPKSYRVKFDLNGHPEAEAIEDQIIVYNNLVEEPPKQFLSGLIMDGWFTEKECINQWNFETGKVDKDITLYVRWVVYTDPSIITVEIEDISLTYYACFWQSAANGVEVDWGDGTEISKYSTPNAYVKLEHNYTATGTYNVKIACKTGLHKLGNGASYQTFTPASCITNVELALNMSETLYYAFAHAHKLTSFNLTRYFEKICPYMFYDCTGLQTLPITNKIRTIEKNAFYGCTSITGNVVIPDSVTKMDEAVFAGCTGITSIKFPKNVQGISSDETETQTFNGISESMCAGCTALTEIIYPENIEAIGANAFFNTALAQVTIPNTVTTIYSSAFSGANNVTKIIIPKSVTTVGYYIFGTTNANIKSAGPIGSESDLEFEWDITIPDRAFQYLRKLNNIRLVDTIKKIGGGAFYYCDTLSNIELPAGLEEIGEATFMYCSALSTFNIPFNVVRIGANCFFGNIALRTVNLYCTSVEEDYKVKDVINSWFRNCASSTELHINKVIVDASQQFGPYWNYYSNVGQLTYIADLE